MRQSVLRGRSLTSQLASLLAPRADLLNFLYTRVEQTHTATHLQYLLIEITFCVCVRNCFSFSPLEQLYTLGNFGRPNKLSECLHVSCKHEKYNISVFIPYIKGVPHKRHAITHLFPNNCY
jgi:hypothetical protein